MGRLDRQTRYYLADMLIGFLAGDYRQVAEVHFAAGYVPRRRSIDAFTQACRSIGEPILGRPLHEISIARLLAQLFQVTVFLLAGTIKGLVGLGLPTMSIALTTLVLPLTEAIALIALPTIVTNVWQAAIGGQFPAILRRQAPLIVPLTVELYITMWQIGQKGPNWAFLVLEPS